MDENKTEAGETGGEKQNYLGLYLMVGVPIVVFVLILLHEAGLF